MNNENDYQMNDETEHDFYDRLNQEREEDKALQNEHYDMTISRSFKEKDLILEEEILFV